MDAGGAVSGAVGRLRTARLVLRPWTMPEANAVLAGRRLSGWSADFPDADSAEQAAWALEALPDPFGFRLVVERSSKLVVGSVGLEGRPSEVQAELFFALVPSLRGRGYATEAVRALTAHAFEASEVEAVFAHVEPSNPASVRVLEKAGFVPAGPVTEKGTVRYAAPPPSV
ncbi:GNAT family N-acetyltransferase [Glycomyces sp. NPDC049804]|uniref:GNAT family N-acetyltransferase n=1 Tax=Glycomyces sp. NPDC049804 TaxID=3154363 RepID=UPI00343A5DD6